MRSRKSTLLLLIIPCTSYPFSKRNSLKYEPSWPVTPVINAFFAIIVYRLLSFCTHGVVEEVFVSHADAVLELSLVGPAKAGGFGDIEELSWGAVRSCGVPLDFALVAHDLGHELGEGFDGEFLAGAGIDGFVTAVVVHEEHAEVGQVINIEELAKRAAVAPAGDLTEAGLLGFVETADEGRQHVAVLGMVVVVGPVEVGGHHGDVVCAVLAVEELAVLEAADLGQSIGLVGLLQFTGQQAAFFHRLGSHARIDAAGAQELEFLTTVLPRRMNHVHLQDHVVVHKVGQRALVGHNAAHLGGRQEHVLGVLLFKEGFYLILPREVQLLVRPSNDIGVTLALKFPDNR